VRRRQDEGVPIVTIYPSGIIGPDDWTESINLASVILWLEKGFPMARNISGSYVDVRDLAELAAASLHPGGGPRRYLAMGTYATAAELVAAIEEAIGARVRTLPTPQVVMWAWGRLGDVARRFGRDIVMTSDGYDYLFHSKAGDDSPTTAATGVAFRPLVDTFRDTFRWLCEAGKIDPSKVGVLAGDP
jgi:nucleoside-diphosphate-sugar epimerase